MDTHTDSDSDPGSSPPDLRGPMPSRLKRRVQRLSMDRKKLGWYAAEIVVIFLGITASFLFDEWRDQRLRDATERRFIASLAEDMRLKQQEVADDNLNLSALIVGLEQLLAQPPPDTSTAPPTTLLDLYHWDFVFFGETTTTYEFAQGSEVWLTIPDSLKRQIYSFYYYRATFSQLVYTNLATALADFQATVNQYAPQLPQIAQWRPFDYTHTRQTLHPHWAQLVSRAEVKNRLIVVLNKLQACKYANDELGASAAALEEVLKSYRRR